MRVQVAISTLRPGDGQPRQHLVHRRIVLDVHLDVLLAQRLASDNSVSVGVGRR